MIKVHYDENGVPSFYDTSLNYPNGVPVPNIQITKEQHADFFARGQNYRVIDGEWTYVEPQGSTLEELKELKRQQINDIRNAEEQSVFLFAGNPYDADKDSVQRISIAAQNAVVTKMAGVPFKETWTLADNTTVILDADGMLGVSQALAVHSATVHAIARQLKEQIDAATTPEELEAITWPEQGRC